MATVYLARDVRHDRAVALKVLRPELAASLGTDRFLREIRTTAQLTHPHILPLHDSGEAAGFLYYTMPFVQGESLRDRLSRERQLPLDDALQIAREVADALGYAHALGLVHRDIKPENILFEAGHAVVADFGIAKAIAAAGSERLTETGLAIGTPQYMSPEQAAGSKDVDGRSDLYSLGCVLYEMLSGDVPYTASTPQAVIAKKLSEPLPRISVVRETVPAGIEAALGKALARTPADRFATTGQFAEALAHPETVDAALTARRPTWWRRRAVRLAAAAAIVVVVIAALWVGRRLGSGTSGSHRPRTAIAVLPLENLSLAGPHGYFAGGLQGELITQLTKVAALSVISRTSVMGYAGTTKPVRQIGAELGVGSVVEGSVQVEGKRLRVNVQLIDASSDRPIWADRYDRTLDDAFAVQSEIAQAIVGAVGATLTRAETGAIATPPTANAEAYRLYLQGEEYRRRPCCARQDYDSAQRLLERALVLDPNFALAHAALSQVHGQWYWQKWDPNPERAARQRAEAETALRLAPGMPQAHLAMGVAIDFAHNYALADMPQALKEFQIAAEGMPGSGEVWFWVGDAYWSVGDWNGWQSAYDRSARLDPRNAEWFQQAMFGFVAQHRYRDAVAALNRSLVLAPDPGWEVAKGQVYVMWQGQFDTLRAVVARFPADYAKTTEALSCRVWLALMQRSPGALLALLPQPQRVIFELQGQYEPALLYVAWAQRLRGDTAAAQLAFRGALRQIDSAARRLADDWRIHASRGLVLAGLGEQVAAQREADWFQREAIGSAPQRAVYYRESRALILAQARLTAAAVTEIEQLLAGPSFNVSGPMLRLDPRWDPIRHDPRFQALLSKYVGR